DRALNQQELSDRLFVDKSNLTGVAGRMETAGLIERSDDPKDKRAYRLCLTDAGRKVLADMEEPYWNEVMGIMGQFSVEEAGVLTGMMRRMQVAIQKRRGGEDAGGAME
ncbi:MAG: MarR family transcriptional regulator, partial [Planctomycetota bacterium]|nr:MarR family transcriptional regulator [Planctomycetota bacterium]